MSFITLLFFRKKLLLITLISLLSACGGGATDGGTTDSGATDSGTTDGGTTDGGATDGGATDGGATDGGATDGGATDGGSTDGGADGTSAVEMIEGFGGALVENETFTFPAGAEVWAGFANLNTDIYPFTFASGGTITFTAAVAAGGADTNVYFRFERLPHPDVEPSFNLNPVLISGETEQQYTVAVPAQAASNTYESFLLYVVERDSAVMVKNIVVIDSSTGGASDGGTSDGGASDGGASDEGASDGGASDGGSTDGVTSAPPSSTAPFDTARAGKLDGSKIWQLPDSPAGDRPDQCWLAVGSDASGEIYISGHDHINNSMMYRLYQSDDKVRWIGDARTASEAANNWQSNESAEKFHTRPIHHNDNVYVATLDNSNMNNEFLNTRGFHWYGYSLPDNIFNDLSASEANGVGAPTLQLATIQVDPINNLLYGMSIPENKLVRYDIEQGTTTVLGKPSAWGSNYFYTNRFMWVDSRGRVYISGGSSRGQGNQGEPSNVFDHIWYYDPVTGFGELPKFALQGPNSMEVGQWDRKHENLYTSDDQGNIYKFNDAAASWTFLGRPNFPANYKTWVFQLSADNQKIYIGQSDGAGPNTIHEFDIASGSSYELLKISDLDDVAATEDFITGYDSWDSQGSFYIADFSMYDGDNVYMLGINPVRIKAAKGILSELVEVSVVPQGSNISLTRSGSNSVALEVLYEVKGFDANGVLVNTGYGTLNVGAQQSNLTFSASSLVRATGSGIVSETFSVIPDGNDYVTGSGTKVNIQ